LKIIPVSATFYYRKNNSFTAMKYLFALLLFTVVNFASAQTTVYLKFNGSRANSIDSADYYRVVGKLDTATKLYPFNEFYKNGTKKRTAKSLTDKFFKPQGEEITYFSNGKVESKGSYNNGGKQGLFYNYFPNGQLYTVRNFYTDTVNKSLIKDPWVYFNLIQCTDSTGRDLAAEGTGYYIGYDEKFSYITEEGPVKSGKRNGNWKGTSKNPKLTFKEQYQDGKLLSGTSVDSAGQSHAYTVRLVSPEYPDGVKSLYSQIGRIVRYPADARRNDIQGTVFVQFTVMRDGTIQQVRVPAPVYPSLDREAIRVVSQTQKWQPALYYGVVTNVLFRLPVSFKLAD
jgi:TonB family protein